MSQTFSSGAGRKVISRASAEELGSVKSFVVDVTASQVAGIQIGGWRGGAEIVDWSDVHAFGDDAVIVVDDNVAHEPNERQTEAAKGHIDAIGSRVIGTDGIEIGAVTDVMFDGETGAIRGILTEGGHINADRLRSLGSYALVIDAEIA